VADRQFFRGSPSSAPTRPRRHGGIADALVPVARVDMSTKTYVRFAMLLSAAGFLFSGYLSWTRMKSGVCAFAEPCPFFLGHPACYTGFALFSTALAISLVAWLAGSESSWPMLANGTVALVGTLFAGRMATMEVTAWSGYRLGLPTCAYGALFFAGLLTISVIAWLRHPRPGQLVAP
jgi:uncharacterized membrane protein